MHGSWASLRQAGLRAAEADAAVLLSGLGVEDVLHERRMGELQGGQKIRVLLAQALFGAPPALLLDEPTNHLDLEATVWLEEYLRSYPRAVKIKRSNYARKRPAKPSSRSRAK